MKAIVIDLDYAPLISILDHAFDVTKRRELFQSTTIHLVFDRPGTAASSKAKLDEWLDWARAPIRYDVGFVKGTPMAEVDWEHMDVEEAFLAEVDD